MMIEQAEVGLGAKSVIEAAKLVETDSDSSVWILSEKEEDEGKKELDGKRIKQR